MQQVEIRVKGRIDERWSEWLDGLQIRHTAQDETVLAGTILDLSVLYGLMSKLRDLGLSLVGTAWNLKCQLQIASATRGEKRPMNGNQVLRNTQAEAAPKREKRRRGCLAGAGASSVCCSWYWLSSSVGRG